MYRFLDPPDTRKEKRIIWAATRGAGVSGMPVRFNCPAEVTIIQVTSDK